jgi:hypothetical protein
MLKTGLRARGLDLCLRVPTCCKAPSFATNMRIAEMKIPALMAVALATVAFTMTPALAQRSAAEPGNYASISMIKTLPGQFENYVDYLNSKWKEQQAWAKSKGYILNYRVWTNIDARANEPDLYLIVEFKDWPSNAESKLRQDEFVAMMKQDEHAMDAAAGQRGPMRTLMGSMTVQEIVLK